MIRNVFFDFQSVFPDSQSELSVRQSLSLRENGKSLATLQRLRNILAVTDVTVASARNLLPHLPHFSRAGAVRFPVPFPCPMQHSMPLSSNRPRVVASVARGMHALATVTPVIPNRLGGAVARLQEFSRIACMVHIKPLF